jgi:DNA-binding HxlR family transcriptional regulator
MTDAAQTKHQEHSAADAVALVADKWVIEVLHALRDGQNRYGMMQRAIPKITKKMLTQTLRKLERNGIIERVDCDENPPRVEYFITPAGDALIVRLTQMCEWSKSYFAEVERAREQYDATNTSWV